MIFKKQSNHLTFSKDEITTFGSEIFIIGQLIKSLLRLYNSNNSYIYFLVAVLIKK